MLYSKNSSTIDRYRYFLGDEENNRRSPEYITYTPSGEKVVHHGGMLVDNNGNPLAAYDIAPGTQAGNAIVNLQKNGQISRDERWSLIELMRKRGVRVTDDVTDEELKNMAINMSMAGLPSLEDLGGNHNSRVSTGSDNNANVRNGGNRWNTNTPGEFARLNS